MAEAGIVGRFILLLMHTGWKTGIHYVTPLQYEKIDGAFCVGAGRVPRADWFRNILVNPLVHVQVSHFEFDCQAEPITDRTVLRISWNTAASITRS